ncbi:MAG: hypothetical protein HQL52_16340 [Magnetococcales bacterium]|nr:hypothetical protein [Magnetococcales bacterium]
MIALRVFLAVGLLVGMVGLILHLLTGKTQYLHALARFAWWMALTIILTGIIMIALRLLGHFF